MTRTVFLDRDGVINKPIVKAGKPYAPRSLEEFVYLAGVAEAIEELGAKGLIVVVVTNQPDVATGLTTREKVEEMHGRLRTDLAVDDIRVCYHTDADRCSCRKPQPGMIFEAAQEWRVDLGASFLVGDRWRDIEAGRAAGCRTILIDREYDERKANQPDAIVKSLPEACEWILEKLPDSSGVCDAQHR